MRWACVLALAGMSVACSAPQATEAPLAEEPVAVAEDPVVPAAEPAAAPAAPKAATPKAPSAPAAVKTAAPAAPAMRAVTVPEGTSLALELMTPVASDTSQVEDVVRATLREPVHVGKDMVIPAGAELTGVVTAAERSGRVKGRARVAYSFHTISFNGQNYELSTAAVDHEAEGTKKQDAAKIGIGAGAGAVIGGLLGGGGGAAKGAAIGGAAGTGAVLATRGKEVRLEPGTPVTTSLTAPLVVRIRG